MRKFIVLLLVSVMLLSLVGCGDSENQEENEDVKAMLLKNLELDAVEGMDKEEVVEFLGVGYEEFNIDGSEYFFWTDRGVSGVYEVGIEANEVIYGVWIEGEEGTQRLASFKSDDNEMPEQSNQDEEANQASQDEEVSQDAEIDQNDDEQDIQQPEFGISVDTLIEGFNKRVENTIQNAKKKEDTTGVETLLGYYLNTPNMSKQTLFEIESETDYTLSMYEYENVQIYIKTGNDDAVLSVGLKNTTPDDIDDMVESMAQFLLFSALQDYTTDAMFNAELSDENHSKLNGGGSIASDGYIITKPKNDVTFLNKTDDEEYNKLFNLLIEIDG